MILQVISVRSIHSLLEEFYRERRRFMKKRVWIILSMAAICILLCFARTTDAKAEEENAESKIYNLNITVERNYDYAKQVLDLVNQERKKAGVGTVKMDEELTEAAMTRAMETTVDYDHGRANLLSMRTLISAIAMENIGCGRNTSKEIMDAWMNSKGHRYNILYNKWISVGIGCIKYKDTYFWVQLFSEKEPTGTIRSGQIKNEEKIEVSSKFLHLSSSNIVNNSMQGTLTLALSQPCVNWECFYFEPNTSSFTYESSNPSIATIDTYGKMTALKNGSTTITVYYAGTKDVAYRKTISCKVGAGTTVTSQPTRKPSVSNTSAPINTGKASSTQSHKVTYYCDVVFKKRNGERPIVKKVEKYTLLKKIKKPIKKGYTFLGWYTSDGKKFNFEKTIRSYTVLHAKWKKKK